MSVLTTIEAELVKIRDGVKAEVEKLVTAGSDVLRTEVAVLKADEEKLVGDLKDAVGKAVAAVVAQVQKDEPAAVAAVQNAASAIEAEILAVIEQHLVP